MNRLIISVLIVALTEVCSITTNAFSHLSPYSYCGGDPVNYTDPTGCIIEGATKKDAALAVEDFRAMFPGDEFANFRNLIVQSGKKQNGKSFAPISADALTSAFNGVNLSEDQQALVNMVVNTINSDDVHIIEYTKGSGIISGKAENAFLPGFMSGGMAPYMPTILDVNGGVPVSLLIMQGGGGMTTLTKNGSYSIIILGGEHPNGRAVTTGHEMLGHGRSLVLGIGDALQHEQAIRTENLILRVMGIPYINNGVNHGPIRGVIVPQPSLLPSFR